LIAEVYKLKGNYPRAVEHYRKGDFRAFLNLPPMAIHKEKDNEEEVLWVGR
jgi:hypothetical protein